MTPCVAACWLLVVTCLHLSIFVMKRNLAYTVNSYLTSITGPYENVNWRGGGGVFIFSCSAREISFQIDQFEWTDCIIHNIFKNIEM